MTREIAVDEAIAAALPWDFPGDYREFGDKPNVCTCGHVFRGNPKRTECRVCAEATTP